MGGIARICHGAAFAQPVCPGLHVCRLAKVRLKKFWSRGGVILRQRGIDKPCALDAQFALVVIASGNERQIVQSGYGAEVLVVGDGIGRDCSEIERLAFAGEHGLNGGPAAGAGPIDVLADEDENYKETEGKPDAGPEPAVGPQTIYNIHEGRLMGLQKDGKDGSFNRRTQRSQRGGDEAFALRGRGRSI